MIQTFNSRYNKSMENKILVTLLRHGRSRADDEGVHEGRYDSPLTEVGRAQVHSRVLSFLQRDFQFDLIIASTLQRANETAQIISAALQVPVENDPDWMEWDNGPLAGLPFDLAEELYPQPAFRNPYTPMAGSGESEWDIYNRAAIAVQKLVQRGPGSYLVVAHGGILNTALQTMMGAIPTVNLQGFVISFGDTGYVRLAYYPEKHRWVMLEFVPGE
ncbi:MAG: histidine phosphatase family protein [Chloroflexi bacterium HGW-Chloroflexi-3]|nr:MAG: histidine phosphatase family protein [Chloroflexi bacterium HGW-Chloroflexi-3]